MSTIEILSAEFIKLATDEVIETGDLELNAESLHQVLTDWCEVYEDVPPRNRAETVVRDALLDARDRTRLAHLAKMSH